MWKAANKEDFEDGLKFVTNFYKDDLNKEQLRTQLMVMPIYL